MLLPFLAGSVLAFPLDFYVGGDYGIGGWGYDYDVDVGYPVGYGSSYVHGGYPRSVDYTRSNYVRGSYVGGTEIGTRNEITVRPSYWAAPYSRFYSSYYPYGYYLPGASLLGKVGGDTLYLKR